MDSGRVNPGAGRRGGCFPRVAAAGEHRAQFVLAALPGAVLIRRVGDGIGCRGAGELSDAGGKLFAVVMPILRDLEAEPVELAYALGIGAKGALGAGWSQLEKTQDDQDCNPESERSLRPGAGRRGRR